MEPYQQGYIDGQRELKEHPSIIILQLPTYAENDPKAGLPVQEGDEIFYFSPDREFKFNVIVNSFSTKMHNGVAIIKEQDGSLIRLGKTPVYSSREARDKAMEK